MGPQKSTRDRVNPSDMERLLPDYRRKGKDNGAVPIVPGQISTAAKKKPAQQFSPKPVDSISQKARQSGPVRAGKQRARAVQETYSGLDLVPSETEQANDSERSERSPKRRRCNPQESKIINVSDDDDVMEQSAPLQDTLSGKEDNQQIENGVQLQVPRSPEKIPNRQGHISSDDNDELFTEQASKERRLKHARQNPKQKIIQSVEIQPSKAIRQKNLNSSPSLQRQIKITDKMRHSPDTRESPDEIQGAATVQPVPATLPVHPKKDVSSKFDFFDTAEKVASRPQSSPSNIRQTIFSPDRRQGKRNRNRRKKEQGHRLFEASYVRLGAICLLSSDKRPLEVRVDIGNGDLEAVGGSDDMSHPFKVQLKRIMQVIRGEGSCRKVRLRLSSKAESQFNQMDIELSSTEGQDSLCNLLHGERIKIQSKPSDWMNDAFKNAERDVARYATKSKRPSCEGLPEQASEPKAEPPRRQKLANSLQMDHESASRPSNDAPGDPDNPSASVNGTNGILNHTGASDHNARSHPPRLEVSTSVEIPVKASAQGRQTRSTTRLEPPPTVVCDDDDGDNVALPTSSGKSQKWETPLVYPRFGKKKAEVDAQDRERLRDNEFLNDNLIGFYIRFLEDHLDRTNKEAAKRVYFFNSYFYAALTNTPRNKKLINYESVQKWTRSVDIFSHDYIVVPINEAAHWYVAIICNLPNLQEFSKEEPESENPPPGGGDEAPPAQAETDIQAVPETPLSSQEPAPRQGESGEQKANAETTKEETARQSMAAMTLQDQADHNNEAARGIAAASDEDWPEKEENPKASPVRLSSPPATRASQQKGSKETAKAKASPRKLKKQKKITQTPRDPRQPTIITLDSLNLARSPTIRNLRLYLSEEAKSKKGIDIDTRLIAAQRARSIPLQSNYSDCGLYLLAYVEKFVRNPDLFASKLLRQEMNEKADWPPLTSGQLRLRLRTFLDDLHDEQEQLSREKASEGWVMADQQPISFLLGDSVLGSDSEPGQSMGPGESSNPTANTAQIRSSPQPEKTCESTTQPSAAGTEPEEKSPEEAVDETQPRVPGPSKTPSISLSQTSDAARSPRQKSIPKAVRTSIRYLERSSQHSDQGAAGEVAVVPDSQEQSNDVLCLASPKKSDAEVRVETPLDKPENQDSRQSVTVDDGNDDDNDAVVVYPPKTSQVEVQVKQTPPAENTKSAKGKQ